MKCAVFYLVLCFSLFAEDDQLKFTSIDINKYLCKKSKVNNSDVLKFKTNKDFCSPAESMQDKLGWNEIYRFYSERKAYFCFEKFSKTIIAFEQKPIIVDKSSWKGLVVYSFDIDGDLQNEFLTFGAEDTADYFSIYRKRGDAWEKSFEYFLRDMDLSMPALDDLKQNRNLLHIKNIKDRVIFGYINNDKICDIIIYEGHVYLEQASGDRIHIPFARLTLVSKQKPFEYEVIVYDLLNAKTVGNSIYSNGKMGRFTFIQSK